MGKGYVKTRKPFPHGVFTLVSLILSVDPHLHPLMLPGIAWHGHTEFE